MIAGLGFAIVCSLGAAGFGIYAVLLLDAQLWVRIAGLVTVVAATSGAVATAIVAYLWAPLL
jgi:hypothetical protein